MEDTISGKVQSVKKHANEDIHITFLQNSGVQLDFHLQRVQSIIFQRN